MVYCGGGLAAQTNVVVLGDLMARIALVWSGGVHGEINLIVHAVSVFECPDRGVVVWWRCSGYCPCRSGPVSYTHLTLPTSDLV